MSLRVQVFLNQQSRLDRSVVFERIIPVIDSVKVDFDNLLSSLRVLFGSSIIVVFEVS